jgi:hypothetical protein
MISRESASINFSLVGPSRFCPLEMTGLQAVLDLVPYGTIIPHGGLDSLEVEASRV